MFVDDFGNWKYEVKSILEIGIWKYEIKGILEIGNIWKYEVKVQLWRIDI
jgi:hypothetical protein